MGFLDFSRFTVTVGTLESAVSTADRLLTFHARCPHEKFTNGSTRFCIDLEQTNKQKTKEGVVNLLSKATVHIIT